MIKHALVPGSDEWHAFRFEHDGSSEAAAMLGLSKLTPRNELLYIKTSGSPKEFSAWVQKNILDYGHKVEALTLPIIEERLCEELFPVTCSDGRLSASCDGMTLDGSITWEHKQANKELIESVAKNVLPEEHCPQCQQNLMVTGADKLVFSVGDGTPENTHTMWVYPDKKWFDRIRAGWHQFNIDRANYVHTEATVVPIATPIRDLPAITYKMDGLSLTTNLQADVKPAILALVEQAKKPLETDQDFADLAALCKKFKQAEDQCALVADQAVGEIKDVAAFGRDLKELQEIMAAARIAGVKSVDSEKESRKLKIISEARTAYVSYVAALEVETNPIVLDLKLPDFALGIKGMAKLDNMKGKCDDMLAEGKIAADAADKDVRAKLAWYNIAIVGSAGSYAMLFNDLQQIIVKPLDDFKLLVTSRIDAHKVAEAAAFEAKRAAIQAEEEFKAMAKAREMAKVMAEAEAATLAADQRSYEKSLAGEPYVLQPESAPGTIPTSSFSRGITTKADTQSNYKPSRIQLIEATAKAFTVNYSQAETWLREAFAEVVA